MLPPQLGRVQRGPGAQPSITEEAERDTAIQPMAARFKLQPDAHAHTYAARSEKPSAPALSSAGKYGHPCFTPLLLSCSLIYSDDIAIHCRASF
ncbi:hypothetical protein AOLI_G00231330 [Acnodon oligacanthus]